MKRAHCFQLISDVHLEHYYARDIAAHVARHPDPPVAVLRKTYMGLDELQTVVASLLVPTASVSLPLVPLLLASSPLLLASSPLLLACFPRAHARRTDP